MSIIKVDNLSFKYSSEQSSAYAIKNLSLEINEGETIAIVGHNGSGKSTLAKLINGLLTPTRGKVYVNGMDTCDEKNLFDIRKTVGVVFQNPDNQMIATIIEDDIAFGPENLGLEPEEIEKRVEWALGSVGMLKERKGTPFKLSGGQKQRIAIAGVLAIKPKVMILDESTAMLDPRGREEVMRVVAELRDTIGMTVIMITHFMDEASEADRIIVLNGGEIYMQGTPQEIFRQADELQSIGLEAPLYARVANKLRKKGLDVGTITSNRELVEKLCR